MSTGYKDIYGQEIHEGDTLQVNAGWVNGEWIVKLGEYRMKPCMKHQIELWHLGWYLERKDDEDCEVVTFLDVIKQPNAFIEVLSKK
jgi:hypothetical protein